MPVPNMVMIHGRDPNGVPRIVEVDANGNLGASIVIPAGTTVGLVAGTTVGLEAGVNNIGDVDVLSIAAGETHIGQMGSESITVIVTPTVTAGIYIAGDCVGGVMEFANASRLAGGGGIVKNLIIVDDAGQDSNLELWLFNQTITPIGDANPWVCTEAELHNLVAIISSTDGSWFATGTPSALAVEVSQQYTCVATSLFGQLVTRDTPTFAAIDDVSCILGLLQD